ncbi:Gaa1-domain-containing protein [Suhomyces tanzawaensis NRRL Y-17324]|uniref:Gaa1-domain-containing protein n=1 Tax=Suhomyces tanzawaensis NRRL Y-17324 TaxID=984487 RepID=A0A1E4SPV8_9ASCO|nr:Gaa1-domain-containing protein [Suhomyces tanzawaensis NRRL Y-17324]ODV81551.1 Gaa1-domain-containing protein [Suhomyces tanzawaensis NRRL Y-17324]
MALAETVLRKVHKLGLIPKAIKLLPVISFVMAIASIGWLLVLPLDGQYRNTYISENALMPFQVNSYFRESEWNIVRGYREEVKKFEYDPISSKAEVVEKWLNSFGYITTYHHNGVTNDTLYAILHAPRGDDTEAMVLAVPWYTSDKEHNEGGIALAAALARYFSKMSIWSKNIILVFPETSHYPLRSWVEAYHTSLDQTAGSIEAAIVLEYGKNGDHFDYYEMFYEGLNGQLPNLDLLNTANMIGFHESLPSSIQGTPSHEISKNTYFTRLRTLLRGIGSLTLSGLSRNTPGCEAFSGWQIQAFTIKAKGSNGPADVTQLGRVVDSTFRSVNNLLEKFHQSFFFYLLLSTRNFVSIGTYLPAAVLVSIAFALSSLGAVLNSGVKFDEYIGGLTTILSTFFGIELCGVVMAFSLPYITINAPKEFEDVTVFQILCQFVLINVAVSFSPLFNIKSKYKFNKAVKYGLIALSLFFISMLIMTLLIVHFALALIIGILAVPLTFIQPLTLLRYVNENKAQIKISLCLFVSNPFFVLFIAGSYLDAESGAVSLMRGLLTSWHELQCWTWFVVILGWFPAWLAIGLGVVFGEHEVDYSKAINKLKSS